MIQFNEAKHRYTDETGKEYISVTTLISKEYPFDELEVAKKCSLNENSKYFQWDVEEILARWRHSATEGSSLHNACEQYSKTKQLPDDPVLRPIIENNFSKLHFKGQILTEQIIWDEELLIAGKADLLEVFDNKIYLYDIKTSNTVSTEKLEKFSIQLNLYKRLTENVFKKPVIIIGIIHFVNFINCREKTQMKILKPLLVNDKVNNIIQKRRLSLKS